MSPVGKGRDCMNPFQPPEKDKPTKWPEIVTLLLGIISFWFSSMKPTPWLVYIPVLFLVLTIVLIIRDADLFQWIAKWYRVRSQNRIGNKVTRKEYRGFVLLIEKLGVAQELASELERTEWANRENYTYFGNVHFGNWYTGIKETAQGLKVKRLSEIKLIAQRLRDYLNAFNGYYVQTLSSAYKQGHAKYPNEDYKKKIFQLKRQYDVALTEHDDFCKAFNVKCKNENALIPVYTLPPDFDWEKGNKS